MKKRKLAESITKESEKEEATPQRYKRLCTPTEGADDTSAINLVVEDTEEEQLKEYHFKVTPKMVEERVKAMKDHLLEIASVPPSEDTPLPHLERHQAWLLLGGYQKHYKNLETYDLGANTFSYYIFPDVMRHLENLFQAKPKPRKGFVPLMACMDTFLKYDLPEYIPDQCYYVSTVLVFETVTKIIMDLEKCSYEMATGIGLGINVPTKTPYGIEWDSLVKETKHRRELARAQRRSHRKQATPRRLLRSKEKR